MPTITIDAQDFLSFTPSFVWALRNDVIPGSPHAGDALFYASVLFRTEGAEFYLERGWTPDAEFIWMVYPDADGASFTAPATCAPVVQIDGFARYVVDVPIEIEPLVRSLTSVSYIYDGSSQYDWWDRRLDGNFFFQGELIYYTVQVDPEKETNRGIRIYGLGGELICDGSSEGWVVDERAEWRKSISLEPSPPDIFWTNRVLCEETPS